MDLSYLDVIIIGVFGISVLMSGFTNIHKVTTFEEFAVGDRNFPLSSLVATLVATYVSGSIFFMVLENVYKKGIGYLFASFGSYIGILVTALFLVPKMRKSLNNLSLAEFIGKFYSNSVRFIIGLAIILSTIGVLAGQFKAFSMVFKYFTEIESVWSVIIPASIIILYSSLGGIRSVIYTDIVQFITLIIPVSIISTLMIKALLVLPNNVDNTYDFFSSQSIDYSFDALVLGVFLMLTWIIDPAIAQRIFFNKDIKIFQKAIIISLILFFLIRCLLSIVPVALLKLNATLEVHNLINFILAEFAYNPGLKGILMVGIIAMTMSTADSWINLASVAFVNDLLSPFKHEFFKCNQLGIAKSFSFILGIFAIFLAIKETNILVIIQKTSSFYIIMAVPVAVLTILGFRTHKNNILSAMISGVLFFFAFRYIVGRFQFKGDYNSYTVILSFLFTLTFILSVHYVFRLRGGWVNTKDPDHIAAVQGQKKEDNFIKLIRDYSIKKELINNIPIFPESYFRLGIVLFLWGVFLLFKIDSTAIIAVLFVFVISCAVLLLLNNTIKIRISEKSVIKYFAFLWNFSLFGLLGLGNSIFFLCTSIDTTSCGIFLINNLVLFLLGKESLVYVFTLFAMGVIFIANITYVPNYFGISYQTPIYQYGIETFLVVVIGMIVTFFIKPYFQTLRENERLANLLNETKSKLEEFVFKFKSIENIENITSLQEREIDLLRKVKQELLANLKSYAKSKVVQISSIAEALYDDLFFYTSENAPKIHEEAKEQILAIIRDSKNTLLNIDNIIVYSEIISNNYQFRKVTVILPKLIQKRIDVCSTVYCAQILELSEKKVVWDVGEDARVENLSMICDQYTVEFVLDNILVHAITYSKSDIRVVMQNIEGEYIKILCIFIQDQDKKENFHVLGYELSKIIIAKHRGSMELEKNTEEETVITISFPL